MLQYDREYAPRSLRNWKVPRWAPTRPRPLAQRPDPKPVADLDGRFLPGVRWSPAQRRPCGVVSRPTDARNATTASVMLQYDREYAPRRLRNWEVPRWAPTRPRPLAQRPDPKPVADLDGRFLPGVPRGTSGPFGHYVGTWDMPRSITRKVAEELSRQPPEGRFESWLRPRTQRSGGGERGARGAAASADPAGAPSAAPQFVDEQGNEPAADNTIPPEPPKDIDKLADWDDEKRPVDAQGNGPYVPGSLTQPEHRHNTYGLLVKDATEQIHGPQESDRDKFWRKVAESATKREESEPAETKDDLSDDNMRDQHPRNRIQRQDPIPKLPSVEGGYYHARKMHMDFLEHQPLPDTLGYRKLTQVGQHRDSDIIVKPYAVAWKGYGASGPTSCTKMRVHRPKTCDAKQPADKENVKTRPATSLLEGKKPISRMDLAICWDYRPQDPAQEPKPPKHIDGSNGSKAPAVFTMVHTPKQEDQPPISAHPNPIFTQNSAPEDMGPHQVPYFEKDMSKNRRKDSCEVQNCPQHTQPAKEHERHAVSHSRKSSSQSGSSRKSKQCDGIHGCGTPSEDSQSKKPDGTIQNKLKPIKEAWSGKQEVDRDVAKKGERRNSVENDGKRNSLDSYDKTSLAQGKLHQSSPNISNASRTSKEGNKGRHKNCQCCNGNQMPTVEAKPKNDYKFAFKAGNPNSVQSSSGSGSGESKALKIPKMRDPYAKKSYSIPTLAPPFCIWRDTSNSGYPEHWRLASVYQHTYKPLDQRRKPLIASVFQ